MAGILSLLGLRILTKENFQIFYIKGQWDKGTKYRQYVIKKWTLKDAICEGISSILFRWDKPKKKKKETAIFM